MKSSIKIDFDSQDKPVISIKCVTSSDDLRDKALTSFLRKLGFTHAHFGQDASLKIDYKGWGGSSGSQSSESYEEYCISPINDSAKIIDKDSYAMMDERQNQ